MGLTVSCRDDGGDIIASLTPSKEKIGQLVALPEQLVTQGKASVAVLQKLAGKLRFARQLSLVDLDGRLKSPIAGASAKAGEFRHPLLRV